MKSSILVAALIAGLSTQAYATVDAAALYKGTCAACHDAAVAGAPKFGDKAAWAPRIAKGMPALMETATKGSKTNPTMMPRGGSKLTDDELKAVVEYMVSKAK